MIGVVVYLVYNRDRCVFLSSDRVPYLYLFLYFRSRGYNDERQLDSDAMDEAKL